MRSDTTRAGRWPLALSFVALATLAACGDDPVAPTTPRPVAPNASAQAAEQMTVTVTNTSGGTQVGSLRWAASQIAAGGGTILIHPSIAGQTIALDAELQFPTVTYIYAPEDKGIVISGKDQRRVMSSTGQFLSLYNVTVTKGNAPYGSAISAVQLALDNSNVQGNRGPGSAVRVEQWLYIGNGTVSNNLTSGPAVEYMTGSQVQIDNSTIAFNAPGAGLGVNGYPTYATSVLLRNSILANNGSPQTNCTSYFGFTYQGKNISSDWSCGEVGITVADPLLMPLAKNGGPVMTHAIPHTSPAYNTGVGCTWDKDARYVTRDAKCDVGAFEFNDFTRVTMTVDNIARMGTSPGFALLTGTIRCTRNETFNVALELHQDQKIGGQIVDVHSAATMTSVPCTTTTTTWARKMFLSEGAWQLGAARATAQTFGTAEWVAPASVAAAVKIARK